MSNARFQKGTNRAFLSARFRSAVVPVLFSSLVLGAVGLSGCSGGADLGIRSIPLPSSNTPNPLPSATPIPGQNGVAAADGSGDVSVAGLGRITFPARALTSGQSIVLRGTTNSDSAAVFTQTAAIFQPIARAPYDVTVTVGPDAVASPTVTATLFVPADFASAITSSTGVEAFVRILTANGGATLDTFELIDSVYNPADRTLTVTLPKEAFTNLLRADGLYEATLTFATTPGAQAQSIPTADPGVCQASALGAPLNGTLAVSTPFSVGGTGSTVPNYGTNFAASAGDDVIAAADGFLEAQSIQQGSVTDPRTGAQTATGWGRYVVLRHDDGSATLYSHLQSDTGLTPGTQTRFRRGDVIGKVGMSGGAVSPGLHFEYVPNGSIFNRKSKIDPFPCIGSQVSGSITSGDNGPVADDAFTLFINGLSIGTTTLGGSNNLSIGNLRPGNYELRLVITTAPDDSGTWFIQLNDGLTFVDDGSDFKSDSDPEGRVLTFQINVPAGGTTRKAHRTITVGPNPKGNTEKR